MNEQAQEQQAQQPQVDPSPLIRALQTQRNFAQDQLADMTANFEVAQGHIKGLSEANARAQSHIDELTAQLDSTKEALAQLQEMNSALDASNVELMRELNELKPPKEPKRAPVAAID
jgi:chromosome segregation ATPase